MVQTVVKEQYQSETLTFRNELFETDHSFEVHGQTVDRSYEDRDVYFNGIWLRGEDAIKLGQALINHGTKALMANMINHQLMHHKQQLRQFIGEQRVQKVVLTVVDEHPANYGSGFRTFKVKPEWNESMAPEYQEDFEYEQVIYFSPFEKEYNAQIANLTGFGVTYVEFVGYDHDKEVAEFEEWCRINNTPERTRDANADIPAVEESNTSGVSEEQVYGNDCRNGQCDI